MRQNDPSTVWLSLRDDELESAVMALWRIAEEAHPATPTLRTEELESRGRTSFGLASPRMLGARPNRPAAQNAIAAAPTIRHKGISRFT